MMVKPSTLALACLACDAALLGLYLLVPRLRKPLFGEDRVVETAGALVLLAAFVAGLAFLTTGRSGRYRTFLLVSAGLGLLGFLDEISFGARLFDWQMPAMFGGGEFDGAHDVVILSYRLAAQADPILLGAAGVCLAAIVLAGALHWRTPLRDLAHRIVVDPPYTLFAVFVVCVTIAEIVDLDIGFLQRLSPVEELLEMNAGLALLLAVVATRRPLSSRAKGTRCHPERSEGSSPCASNPG